MDRGQYPPLPSDSSLSNRQTVEKDLLQGSKNLRRRVYSRNRPPGQQAGSRTAVIAAIGGVLGGILLVILILAWQSASPPPKPDHQVADVAAPIPPSPPTPSAADTMDESGVKQNTAASSEADDQGAADNESARNGTPFASGSRTLPGSHDDMPLSDLKLPGRAGGGAPAGLPVGTGRDPLSGAANPFRSSNRADNPPPRGNAREGDPFGLLPDEVDLGFKTDLAEALDTPIGPLAQSPMVNWNVTIDSSATSLEGLQYSVGAPEKQVAGVRWPIEITTRTSTGENTSQLLQSGEADSAALAYVVAANHQISIAGRPGSNHLQLAQLRNCVLSMSDGVHTKAVQLRRTEQHPVVAVDFQAKEVVINVDLPALPPKDKLLLELCPERPLSDGLQLDSKESRAPIGKELKVNLTKWPGAYLSLRLVTDHDAYAIKVRPRYVLRKQHADMTLDAVGKEIGRLTRQRNQNMRDLTVARGRLQQIPSDLRRAQSMPVRTVKDKSMKSAAIAVLQKEGNKMQAMVKRMASAIPQIEMAIAQLNKLPPILRELQGKAELPLRVVAQRKEGVLVLLTAE